MTADGYPALDVQLRPLRSRQLLSQLIRLCVSSSQEISQLDVRQQLVDVKRAAAMLSVGAGSVRALIDAGLLRVVRIGRCVRIPVADVERFVEQHAEYLCDGALVELPPREDRDGRPLWMRGIQ